MTLSALLLAFIFALASQGASGQERHSQPRYEVWYRATARHRGVTANADLEAGGRLLMARTGISPETRLDLIRVLEDPWKLYSLDPVGLFGEETKYAAVVTLPEGSWKALDAARRRVAALGRAQHGAWIESTDQPRPLDGTFAFVVTGHPKQRFNIELRKDASVARVVNRLTSRWLSGPFVQFVGNWGKEPGAELDLNGYWFSNNGESEPFDYEPHTYHAFAAALELLTVPLPRTPGSVVSWPNAVETASEVLGTLAPKGRNRFSGAKPRTPFEAPVRAETLPNGDLRLSIESSEDTPTLHVERETVLSSNGWPVSNRARVRLESRRGGFFEVETGYSAQDLAEDSE